MGREDVRTRDSAASVGEVIVRDSVKTDDITRPAHGSSHQALKRAITQKRLKIHPWILSCVLNIYSCQFLFTKRSLQLDQEQQTLHSSSSRSTTDVI